MALLGSAPRSHKRSIKGSCTRHSRGADQAQRLMHSRLFRARLENDLGDRSNIFGQSAVTNRILGNELQQGRVAKMVCTFE